MADLLRRKSAKTCKILLRANAYISVASYLDKFKCLTSHMLIYLECTPNKHLPVQSQLYTETIEKGVKYVQI